MGMIMRRGGALGVAIVLMVALGIGMTVGSNAVTASAVPKFISDLSPEELYEKAKAEGKVVIYAKTSAFNNVKASFEAQYPGITVEPYKVATAELPLKLTREHNAKVYNVDVVHFDIAPDLVEGGYMTPFWPVDIIDNYFEEYKALDYPVFYTSLNPIIYNSDVYKTPPVTNWWDLTEPEWRGKVLINDPISNPTTAELMMTIVLNADEMAEAYEEKYGKAIVLTEENAGWEWIARFIANDPVTMSSNEAIIDSIGARGQTSPPIGFAASTKLRNVEEAGMPIAPIFDLAPRASVMRPTVIYMANNAPHPHAGQLFARWAMGETDGQGEGLEPFNTAGTWIPRPDVPTENPVSLGDIKAWEQDPHFYTVTFPKFRNFWLSKMF